jgi:lysophospholipase L1-like esterase
MLPSLPRSSSRSFVAGFLVALAATWFVNHLTLLLSSGDPSSSRRVATAADKVAVVFGDSITQHAFNPESSGWLASVAHYFSRRVICVNRGLSGYNTRFARTVFEDAVIQLRPDLLVLFFGANDATVPGHPTSVPVAEFQQNVEAMVLAARRHNPSVAVVLLTPPPVWEAALEAANAAKKKAMLKDRHNERTRQYADAVLAVGVKHAVPVVDAFAGLEGGSTRREAYLVDGLHLSSQGNRRIFELFVATVETKLKGTWAPTSLKTRFPTWESMVAAAKG